MVFKLSDAAQTSLAGGQRTDNCEPRTGGPIDLPLHAGDADARRHRRIPRPLGTVSVRMWVGRRSRHCFVAAMPSWESRPRVSAAQF